MPLLLDIKPRNQKMKQITTKTAKAINSTQLEMGLKIEPKKNINKLNAITSNIAVNNRQKFVTLFIFRDPFYIRYYNYIKNKTKSQILQKKEAENGTL